MVKFLEEKFNYILGVFFAFIIFGLIIGGWFYEKHFINLCRKYWF